jgi:hypothetical protein
LPMVCPRFLVVYLFIYLLTALPLGSDEVIVDYALLFVMEMMVWHLVVSGTHESSDHDPWFLSCLCRVMMPEK